MKHISLMFILSLLSLNADTFELNGGEKVDINITNQDVSNIERLYRKNPIDINPYDKVCIVNKDIDKDIYINIDNTTSLNINNLCYVKVHRAINEDIMTIDSLLKKIKNTQENVKTFFSTLTFKQRDLRIKTHAEATGDETIPLIISKSKTPILTFEFESPKEVQLILWGETLEESKLKQHRMIVSNLKCGKYGLALETNEGKKIMEFEVTVVE